MTVTTTSNKIIGLGNGATTVWPFTFPAVEASDLVVTYTDTAGNAIVLAAHLYTVILNPTVVPNPTEIGGTVTYPLSGSPIAAGTTLTIERVLPITQETSLANQGTLWQPVIEAALDYLTMLIQQQASIADRVITIPAVDPASIITELPPAAQRALQTFIFDASGNVGVGQPASANVSAAMQPVVAAATIAIARALLGINTTGPTFLDRAAFAAATIDTNVQVVFTSAYASARPGLGGAAFYRVAAPTTGSVQSADGQNWAMFPFLGNPEQMGAIGDGAINGGTGAVTGTDNTTAITNTFNYFAATEFISPIKKYKVSRVVGQNWAVQINTSNHYVRGNGAQLILADSAWSVLTPNLLTLHVLGVNAGNTITNVTIDRLNIYNNARNQGVAIDATNEYNGIQATFVDHCRIINCDISECPGDGIAVSGGSSNFVSGCTIAKCGKNCIYVLTTAGIIGDNTTSTSNWDFGQTGGAFFGGTAYAGVALADAHDCVVSNNSINLGANGIIDTSNGPASNSTVNTIEGNTINTPLAAGISVINVAPINIVTISIAAPGVITLNAHGFVAGTPVTFFTTGTLPTGLVAGTTYYVIAAGLTANTFEVSATFGGAAINTTVGQSGVQTVQAHLAVIKLSTISGNNIFDPGGNGITVQNARFVNLDGNSINDAGNFGILLNTKTQDINVTGNNIRGSTLAGVELIGATACVVDGNLINNNVTYGIEFGDDGSGTSSNVDNTIGTNSLIGNASGEINLGSILATTTRTKARIKYSFTYDPPNTADGAVWQTTQAAVGVVASSSPSQATHSSIGTTAWLLSASVTAGNVTVTALNKTGGAVDLASGTLNVTVDL